MPGQLDAIPKMLLTPEEAGRALSIGRTKVYELLALGVLRSVRIGGSRRVPVAAVAELVERLSEADGAAELDELLATGRGKSW